MIHHTSPLHSWAWYSGFMTQYWLIKTQISSSSLLTLHSQILASFYLRTPNRTLLDENSIQEISKHVKSSRVPYTAAVYSRYDSAFPALDSLSISASHSSIGPLPCPSERTRECVFVRARTPAWLCICASLFMTVKSCYRRDSSSTVPLPCSLPGATPFSRSLTWLPHTAPAFYFQLGLTCRWKAKAAGLPRPLRPSSIVYCEEGKWIRHGGCGSIWTSWAKMQGDKLGVGRKDGLCFFFVLHSSCSFQALD